MRLNIQCGLMYLRDAADVEGGWASSCKMIIKLNCYLLPVKYGCSENIHAPVKMMLRTTNCLHFQWICTVHPEYVVFCWLPQAFYSQLMCSVRSESA